MRRILQMSALAVIFIATLVPTPSFAMTCTDRRQVCFAYCEKNYDNAPPCRATCDRLLSECMSSGCWSSKVTAKQCGITKQ